MWYLLAVAFILIFYFIFMKPLKYWEQRNVPCIRPWPIFGNMFYVIFRKQSVAEKLQELYQAFPNHRYAGMYSFSKPQFLIRDLDLVRQILIKDFDHFSDRTHKFKENVDPIFARNLSILKGREWKHMRSRLSPSFTTSKIKYMFNLIDDCAKKTVYHFENSCQNTYEMKDNLGKFAGDTTTSIAFGIEIDSMKDPENMFYRMGKSMTGISYGFSRSLGYAVCPSLMKFFNVPIFPTDWSEFFVKTVKQNIEERKAKGIVRPDLIQPLLPPHKDKSFKEDVCDVNAVAVEQESLPRSPNAELSIADIAGQAVVFFFAGFDSMSSAMSFMSYELAVNYDVQKKLQKEIDEIFKCTGGSITYESLCSMTYLDMVISEVLRLRPPFIALQRMCVKDYLIPAEREHERPLLIKKSQSVVVPIYSIQRDEKYFPNPEKFDPDRFANNNKGGMSSTAYAPFGIGPRTCIASKLAIVIIKIFFFRLISKFELVPVEKTPIPIVPSRKKISIVPEGGLWLGIKKRNLHLHKCNNN